MKLYFITGNKDKFNEVKKVLPEIEQIRIDLPEIQELDSKKIIKEKLNAAMKNRQGAFFCEDTSLYINCLNGLPGPLVKWFLQSIGNKGIYNLIKNFKDKSAIAKSTIGFSDGEKILFFEAEKKGEIVEPKIEGGYGWDPLFKPEGENKTFAETADKARCMRKDALIKLKNYLNLEK